MHSNIKHSSYVTSQYIPKSWKESRVLPSPEVTRNWPTGASRASLDNLSAVVLTSLKTCWIVVNDKVEFNCKICSIQCIKDNDRKSTWPLYQSTISLESPTICSEEIPRFEAKERRLHKARSYALEFVPTPQFQMILNFPSSGEIRREPTPHLLPPCCDTPSKNPTAIFWSKRGCCKIRALFSFLLACLYIQKHRALLNTCKGVKVFPSKIKAFRVNQRDLQTKKGIICQDFASEDHNVNASFTESPCQVTSSFKELYTKSQTCLVNGQFIIRCVAVSASENNKRQTLDP